MRAGESLLLLCAVCGVLNVQEFIAERMRARQRVSNGVHVLLIDFDSVHDNMLRWARLLSFESFGLINVSKTSCQLVVEK
jgi:hypothetical protein